MNLIRACRNWMAILLLPFLLNSCGQSTTTFQVIRIPSLQAEINGETWRADRVEFQFLGPVVYFGNPNSPEGQLFERVVLVGFERGSELGKLEVTLDVDDLSNLVGNYSTTYEEYGGLHNIEWLEEGDTDGEFKSFSLCTTPNNSTEFVIERQNRTEELIARSFQALLCERLDQNDQLQIEDGSFRDLEYSEEE